MRAFEGSSMAGTFGSGELEVGEWTTPFTDSAVELLEVACAPGPAWPAPARRHAASQPGEPDGGDLVVRVHDRDADRIFRLVFPTIAALRLVDEGGLVETWRKTAEFGGRPGRTTFRVRNHAWTHESVIAFLASDGWSFLIATDTDGLDVVSVTAPVITRE
jgi:hypothetical protein